MKRYLLYLLIAALLCVGCSANKESKSSDALGASDGATQHDDIIEPTKAQINSSEEVSEPSSEAPTEPTEPVTEVSDYILNGTRLVGYVGDDTELTLPDDVTAIAAYAFKDAPATAQITSVHLGAKVTEIEIGAFTGMHSLCTFTVDPQNPQFYAYEDHTLVSLDGTLYFAEIDETGEEFEFLFEGIIEEVEAGERSPHDFTSYVLGPAKVEIEFHPNDPFDEGTGKTLCFLSAVSAYGYEHVLDTPLQMWWGNGSIQTIPGEKCFIVSHKPNFNKDHYLMIFTENGFDIGSQDRVTGEDSNVLSSYWYYRVPGDAQLYYKRSLNKFMFFHAVDSILARCVSRDEFCYEIGVVNSSENGIEYIAEEVKTVSDIYDLEENFQDAQRLDVFSEYSTLDELLTANAEKYERGY